MLKISGVRLRPMDARLLRLAGLSAGLLAIRYLRVGIVLGLKVELSARVQS